MNLHVTNDENGYFPQRIAIRIKESGKLSANKMVNLCTAVAMRDEIITYIPISSKAIRNYIDSFTTIDKIIFHPYTSNSYRFLKIVKEKFPGVKVYWVCWSYELYNLPHVDMKLYNNFSSDYLANKLPMKRKIINSIRSVIEHSKQAVRIKKSYPEVLDASYGLIDYFCSMLPSDFAFFRQLSTNKNIRYIPFAYLSLNDIMPNLTDFRSTGDKIMIGHSSSPKGNHYEILETLKNINPGFNIFLPLSYGDKHYANIIRQEAVKRFKNLEIQDTHLTSVEYSRKLTQVGWVIINVKVQQGLGNILALAWMGAKIFLNENTSTYKDFSAWGIKVFTIQHDLNIHELSEKLDEATVRNNREKILERFNEEKVRGYWEGILN